MPKAFSDKEREQINKARLNAAMDSMRKVGGRKINEKGCAIFRTAF